MRLESALVRPLLIKKKDHNCEIINRKTNKL
jgi:hypothetical protein